MTDRSVPSAPSVRVTVDGGICQQNGMCINVAPELFAFDEADQLIYAAEVATEDEELVRRAAAACPVAAIRVSLE